MQNTNELKKKEYKAFDLRNFKEIPQISALSEEHISEIEVVAHVLPFKTNNYVIDELINWDDPLNDSLFKLTFPQKGMLKSVHFNKVKKILKSKLSKKEISKQIIDIRQELNPHPAGQSDLNIPYYKKTKLEGVQHKYGQTVLFFPSQGQTCHAYCTFCFRWSQFVSMKDKKFAKSEITSVIEYIKTNAEISDILITGGDPMIMKASI